MIEEPIFMQAHTVAESRLRSMNRSSEKASLSRPFKHDFEHSSVTCERGFVSVDPEQGMRLRFHFTAFQYGGHAPQLAAAR